MSVTWATASLGRDGEPVARLDMPGLAGAGQPAVQAVLISLVAVEFGGGRLGSPVCSMRARVAFFRALLFLVTV